ncbi:hypothetical protein MmiHf6_00530 [Methanimicrococcus hongohii]|uniref:N-acetyltransferase domain-containing protein n=1 Tax=Methanimicrococcus hongohii TaxID=3028295 RepID=A0AA96UZ66_9EURY|nr:GNAT family N-acetyltransferase [Methanimicrococcus sp. Hf6]WNY22768.1 hypothetical protein MmiHf6_00530 [Methanimicrococcus sp. Hf6]
MIFLEDYAQVMVENCHFTYVAVADDGQVIGLISGLYQKNFDKKLSKAYDYKRHYGLAVKFMLKYFTGLYYLSDGFKRDFKIFFAKLQERNDKMVGVCDCELAALTTRKEYRKGLGTALVNKMVEHCREKNVKTIRVFTNTASTYGFYDKYGFDLVKEVLFTIKGVSGRSLIYELEI